MSGSLRLDCVDTSPQAMLTLADAIEATWPAPTYAHKDDGSYKPRLLAHTAAAMLRQIVNDRQASVRN